MLGVRLLATLEVTGKERSAVHYIVSRAPGGEEASPRMRRAVGKRELPDGAAKEKAFLARIANSEFAVLRANREERLALPLGDVLVGGIAGRIVLRVDNRSVDNPGDARAVLGAGVLDARILAREAPAEARMDRALQTKTMRLAHDRGAGHHELGGYLGERQAVGEERLEFLDAVGGPVGIYGRHSICAAIGRCRDRFHCTSSPPSPAQGVSGDAENYRDLGVGDEMRAEVPEVGHGEE